MRWRRRGKGSKNHLDGPKRNGGSRYKRRKDGGKHTKLPSNRMEGICNQKKKEGGETFVKVYVHVRAYVKRL